MTDSESNAFDLDRLKSLAKMMDEHQLFEVDLREGDQRIRLSRGASGKQIVSVASEPAAAIESAPSAPASATPTAAEPANVEYIVSPMVGTFYSKPNPESEPYVKVGDPVDEETRVCIIEAMKVFTEIPARVRGRIVQVLVEEGEHVDVDKPLFKVDTSG